MNSDPTPPQIDVAGQEVVAPPVKNITPISWRLAILAALIVIGSGAYFVRHTIGLKGQSAVGVVCFFGLVALFSTNLRAVNWKTIGAGFLLQCVLAVLVLQVPWFRDGIKHVKDVVVKFIDFSNEGSKFVFGNLYDARPAEFGGTYSKLYGTDYLFQFAFVALPPILFVSAFFTMLYHFGILQKIVQGFSWIMRALMGTSGAETLSVAANVFMGQTEAPLIVKPYVPRMTRSELFTLMTSGFAHISGGLMVVYIGYGADPVAVLTTCIMACPASLYLAKLYMPETSTPETAKSSGLTSMKSPYANAVDAISAGTKDGLQLALNVAAMLIVFIAFVAMIDAVLGIVNFRDLMARFGADPASLPEKLSLGYIFGVIFSPVAFLIGIEDGDITKVATLLGKKLSQNEHVAYLDYKNNVKAVLSERSRQLVTFALTGFANFASIGIQLGGIGAMAPTRRAELARIGGRALFVGFVATLLNAAIAGILLPNVIEAAAK